MSYAVFNDVSLIYDLISVSVHFIMFTEASSIFARCTQVYKTQRVLRVNIISLGKTQSTYIRDFNKKWCCIIIFP